MINGIIQIELFAYQVVDGNTQVTKMEPSKPVKLLSIKDHHSGLTINLFFTLDDWNNFIQNIQGNKIVASSVLPSKIGLMPQ